jgi:integrase/recombinase XerD
MGHESIHTTLRYQKVTSQKAEEAAHLAFSLLTNVDKLD